MDTRAEDALRLQASLEAERANFDSHCQEVADRVLTRQREFTTKRNPGGEKQNEKVFDSTAPLALEKFAAAIEGMLTPRASRWHDLTMRGRDADDAAKKQLAEVTDTLFRYRYRPGANFASQAHETYIGIGAFGNGCIFVDDEIGRGPIYRAIPFAQLWWSENFQGRIDTVHRKFELTARQWMQKFGDETPQAIQKAAEIEPNRKFELIHCVRPREDADWSRGDYRGMAYASYYVSFEGRKLLKEGGYRTMRYACARYVTAPREVYGRGPAMTVLADIKSVNEQQKTLLRTGQKIADPPMLLTEDGCLGGFKMQPGALNRGAVGPGGEELVKPLQVGANLPITLEMVNQTRSVINDAFLVTLFQILVDGPQITATEAMLRAQEKGTLLAPTMGRLQTELLDPIVQAELDILAQMGVLPELPPEMYDDEDMLAIEYTSPLARMMKAEEGIGIMRTIESAVPIMQIDQGAATVFQGKGADIIRRLAEVNGMAPDLLNTDEEVQAATAQQQERARMADILGAADVASGAAKNFAQAQAAATASPGQLPAIIPEAA